MMTYTDYTVRLGDLKRAIVKNPYDPNLNIDGYMRYLKYNTPSAQPEIIRCKDCKYVSVEPCKDYENVYVCNRNYWTREQGGNMPNDFCSHGERK